MKLKKSLGQNFFNNPTLALKICNIVVEKKPSYILEIGPGDGYFTKIFKDLNQKIIVIEKDNELSANLKLKFPDIQIINNDFFDVNIQNLDLGTNPVVYGSLPYNVSKFIIRELLEKTSIQDFYFIIQKEVAQKYQGDSDSSLQFMTTKLYADTKIMFNISPGSFIPRPKVESSFVHISRNNNIKDIDSKLFIEIIKHAFSSPRKTLRNNFKGWDRIKSLDLQFLDKRAQELSFENFKSLYNQIKMV